MSRREFLATGGSAIAAAGVKAEPVAGTRTPFELDEATIGELGARMARGETTAVKLVQAYLERAKAIDTAGPMLRSVIEVNPDALEIAEALDRERAAGRVRGPLHGK